jgi:hypothetical protein
MKRKWSKIVGFKPSNFLACPITFPAELSKGDLNNKRGKTDLRM